MTPDCGDVQRLLLGGLRGVRVGEASNPGPADEEVGSGGERLTQEDLLEIAPTQVDIDDEWSTTRASRVSPSVVVCPVSQ